MRVGVDQARRQNCTGLFQLIPGGILPLDLGARPDLENALPLNGDGSIFDHAALRIFGHDVAGAPDQVDRSPAGRLLGWQQAAKQQRASGDSRES
jgi:hypothetical protein